MFIYFEILKQLYLFRGVPADVAGGLLTCKAEPGNGSLQLERKDLDGDNLSLYLDPDGSDEEDRTVSGSLEQTEQEGVDTDRREPSGGENRSKRNRPTEIERLCGVSLGDQIRTRSSLLKKQ